MEWQAMDAARAEIEDAETENQLAKLCEYDADEELEIVEGEKSIEDIMLSSDVGAAGLRSDPRSEEERVEIEEYDEPTVQGQILQAKTAAHRSAVDRRNAQRYGRYTLATQRTYDALTKQLLDEELVRQGKEADMSFLRQWQVYEHVAYEEAWAASGENAHIHQVGVYEQGR